MSLMLRVGTLDLDAKDRAVLRSLMQLVSGQLACPVRFSDDASECSVLFVPADWRRRLPATCITVRVAGGEHCAGAGDDDGFVVAQPLRLAQVRPVLEAAAELLANGTRALASEGMRAVFVALARHVMARERRTTLLRLSDGHELLLDFSKGQVRATMSRQELMNGLYVMQAPQRALPQDEARFDRAPAWPLRPLVWELAAFLGDAGVEGAEFKAAYKLRQNPAGTFPGATSFQRLAEQWQAEALTLPAACARSGASLAQAQWFLEACFAMGLLASQGEGDAPGAISDPVRGPAVSATEPRALLGRIMSRLRGR